MTSAQEVGPATHPEIVDAMTQANAAATVIADRTGVESHRAAIVLGSGWAPAVDQLGDMVAEIPLTELPGFAPPTASGHVPRVRSVKVNGHPMLVFLGRTHLYEGLGVAPVVHGVRVAAASGCQNIVLTNAAGGLRAEYQLAQPVLISDHLNLTGRSPLVGGTFVDLTEAYSPRLRQLARSVDPWLNEGVYAALTGPHYETPAEIRMLRRIGADLVGMSTVLETIAARAVGVEVLGISLVTNVAAGMTGEPLDHREVLAAGQEAAARIGKLLADILARL